jgi:uncharacterized protein involved in outer membrane biogenesis
LLILGVIVVVIAVAVGFVLSNLNAYLNSNKDWLAAQVEGVLGRKVSFSEIGVSLSSGFGARIKDVRIADDPAFSQDDFVRAGTVEVSVKFWPALFRRFEVKRLVLEKPDVTILRTRDGMNYDSIGKTKNAEAPPVSEAPKALPSEDALVVALVDIKGGRVHFVDMTTSPQTDFSVSALDGSAQDVSATSPVRLHGAASLFGADQQNVRLDGTVGPVGTMPNTQTIPVDVSLQVSPLVLDELKKLPALAQALPPALASSDPVTLEAKTKGTAARLDIEATVDATSASLVYGTTFTKPKSVPLRLALAASRTHTTIDVQRLSLQLAELALTSTGTVTQGGAIDFQIDSQPTPLAGWDRLLPAFAGHQVSGTVEVHVRAKGTTEGGATPTLDGTVTLANVSATPQGSPYAIVDVSTRLTLAGQSIDLPPTSFTLSGSPVDLQAQVTTLKPLSATFAMQSPELKAASLGFASPHAHKPEVLRGLGLQGILHMEEQGPSLQATLRSSDGSLRDVDYQALAATLDVKDHVVSLSKLSLRAFDGSYDGGGRYDMRDAHTPKFDSRSIIRGMDLRRLLATHAPGAEKKIEGRLDADLALTGAGKGWETIPKTLAGHGRADVQDGVLTDVNLADQVLASVTGVPGLSQLISPRVRSTYPAVFSTGDTKFTKLGGSVQIANGVARSDDLMLEARDYAMRGKGTFALDNELDITATLVASKQLSDAIVADVRAVKYIENDQGKVEIPFRLTGALPQVTPKPDIESLTRSLSRAVVGKGVEEIFGKDKPTPAPGAPPPSKHPERDLLKKGLQGLFGK